MGEKVINIPSKRTLVIKMENDKFKLDTDLKEIPVDVVERLLNEVLDTYVSDAVDQIMDDQGVKQIVDENINKILSDANIKNLFRQVKIYKLCIILLLLALLSLVLK